VIEYLRIYSRPFLFTASAVPASLGAALAALRVMRSPDGPPLLERVLANARLLRDGLEELGFAVVAPQVLPDDVALAPGVVFAGDGAPPRIVTPIVPVLVGDDWKAALLWRALYDRGVFVNTALHPAVPPGGALLRTSVMATHDAPVLERALAVFAAVKREFEAEHGPLGPCGCDPVDEPGMRRAPHTTCPDERRSTSRFRLSNSSQVLRARKKVASSARTALARLTGNPVLA
jgi:8-amino-7-oxononanoate synthase